MKRETLTSLLALSFLAGCAHSEPAPAMGDYLSIFKTKTTETLALTEDATFYGPLLSEPIKGRDQITQFYSQVLPSLELIEVTHAYEGPNGGCAELVFKLGERELEEAHCIRFEQGRITSIRLYFDPRPFLGD